MRDSCPPNHLRLNFEFRPKGIDLWDATAKGRLFVGLAFHSTTTVNFGSTSQTATTSEGIVGAGNKMTAVGGVVFNGSGAPQANLNVCLFSTVAQASCTTNANLVAQDVTDANGFYGMYRSGTAQNTWAAPNLPSGVKFAVQLCSLGGVQFGIHTLDSSLRD